MSRTCAHDGCNQSIAHRSAATKYCSERHRQAHYRARVKAAATAAGLPPNLSLAAVQQSTPTKTRNGDAQTARKPPKKRRRTGLSVYFPTIRDAEAAHRRLATIQPTAADLQAALAALARALDRHKTRA